MVITTVQINDPELVEYTCPECHEERIARIPKYDKPISLADYRNRKEKNNGKV